MFACRPPRSQFGIDAIRVPDLTRDNILVREKASVAFVGLGSVSATMTLQERKTQHSIIVNLPQDHTAASVDAAGIAVFKQFPPHL